jgi:Asp-tRNA(Asn)/Glu-tRNA(Gln) amidotransferase A subunit family amidase
MLPSGYTLTSAAQALAAEKLSAVELTQSYLQQIRGLNHTLNAYVTVFEEQALTQARQSDERRREGKTASVLDGIPLAIKDNILVQGTITTAGSAFLAKYVAPYDASVTTKLKQAGAIFLGKTNMDEYAMGGSTEHSAFGPTKHPRDLSRVPGGSSGGSACAVAADLCVAALGSDTGGSIRQPASFCGLVGFKPSYGRVSRYGLIAMASSFDQIGPMTKTVEDAALLQSVIEGADTFDQTTATLSPTCFETTQLLQGVRIGLPRQAWGAGMSDEVRTHTMRGIEQMRALGAEIKGGLGGTSDKIIRSHTAHHLLLAALRQVLGEHVHQRGSNITDERIRIDFSHDAKMTDEQKAEVERLVNEWIKMDLPMQRREMPRAEAEQVGAEMEFGVKYPDTVSVYYIGSDLDHAISKEFCGGPHVERTGIIQSFTLVKEEASSAGVRRIKATIA